MTSPTSGPLHEEPWELEVGALLGRLPDVDPPDGFIDAALDRPPHQAGRLLAVLSAITVVALAAASLLDSRGPASVVPPVDELLARHDLTALAGSSVQEAEGAEEAEGVEGADQGSGPGELVELPAGFHRAAGRGATGGTGTAGADELRQAVYARGDQSVSVFVQDGPVAWESLPPDRMTELDGVAAWVDTERRVAVIEIDGVAVTIVGLGAGDVGELRTTARPGGEAGSDAQGVVDAIVRRLGFSLADE